MPFHATLTIEGKSRDIYAHQVKEDTIGEYFCIECKTPMKFIHCEMKRSHFRHVYPDKDLSCSGGESPEHRLAKSLVCQNLHKLKFNFRCQCGKRFRKTFDETTLAVEEFPYAVQNSSFTTTSASAVSTPETRERRLDIGVLNSKKELIFGIEIYHTHAVDKEKALDLTGLKWLEVSAEYVISSIQMGKYTLETTPNTPYELCEECYAWKKLNEERLRESGGKERFFKSIYFEDLIIESIFESGKHAGEFPSDVLNIDPSYIGYIAQKAFFKHNEICKKLLFGKCINCGCQNLQSLTDSQKKYCITCWRKKQIH